MSWKTNVVIGMTVLGGVVGVNQMLSVKTPDDMKHYRQEQQIEQGGDAVDMQNERNQEKLPGGIDAENSRKLTPSELRSADPHLKPRIRP
jgi:hypothetical protein